MSQLIINTDGGSRGNPGNAAIGAVFNINDEIIYEISKNIGIATNNEAEYMAVIAALSWLETNSESFEFDTVKFFLDSKLVVEQLNKTWKIKEIRMKKLAEECWLKISSLPYSITFSHISREKNSKADSLVNKALDSLVT